jgi:hypothetical protein
VRPGAGWAAVWRAEVDEVRWTLGAASGSGGATDMAPSLAGRESGSQGCRESVRSGELDGGDGLRSRIGSKRGAVDVGSGRREEVQRALSAAPGRPGVRAEQKKEKEEKRSVGGEKRERTLTCTWMGIGKALDGEGRWR